MSQPLDDIAIVGIACRYPGEAKNTQSFLSMLQNGRAAWSKIPKDRFDTTAYYHPSNERQGNICTNGGHFLEQDVATFDAPFFSITAAEANAMDPQQRMLLEVTYEALESAGIPMHKMIGSNTSVYVGCFTRDYEIISARQIDDTLLYQATGQGFAMQSNRLSWFYDLKGPSLTLDTACSSSLLALHLACQSIRNGESQMSVVGGTGLMLSPDIMRTLTALHFLSPDGRCFSFDERANGYARGEGIGTVILKPVADAVRDGDNIRAVIRGTGTNQDGRTPGITLPSSEAQAQLIAKTYCNAKLSYGETQYFEAHGTGTPAGDPIELAAIGATFGSDTSSRSRPLYVGSVKTNIGHLEGGAGLAGLIKAVLSLETGCIFPSLNFERPNPRLRLSDWNLQIPTDLTPWPTNGLRRASVNSFGYGGSNVHAIVDDAYHYLLEKNLYGFTNTNPKVPQLESASDSDSGFDSGPSSEPDLDNENSESLATLTKRLFVLSGPDQASLRRLQASYASFIEGKKDRSGQATFLARLAYTLSSRRSIYPWRQAIVGASPENISTQLRDANPTRSKKSPLVAFIFTGQGAQWCEMGKDLMSYDIYASSISKADAFLQSLGAAWSVEKELYADAPTSRINEAEYAQPLCTILQVALVDQLAHWGVKPRAVAGHSSGEIAAAYAAGLLSAEDAWRVAFERGRAARRVSEVSPQLRGGMTAIGLSETKTRAYLNMLQTSAVVVIACINSEDSTTVSGDTSALEDLENRLNTDGIFNRRLKVTNAYHSPHMNCVAEEYKQSILHIRPLNGNQDCTFFSSVTGVVHDGTQLDADYWVANLTSPVKFLQAVQQMIADPAIPRRKRQKTTLAIDTFVEIGPAGALQGPLRQIISTKASVDDISVLSMLARNKDAIETSLTMIGKLWTSGLTGLHLDRVNDFCSSPRAKQPLCDAPTYPWNHTTRYWHEGDLSRNHRFPRAPRLDLLGFPNEDWNPSQPAWRNRLTISELPWIREHVVQGSIIFPAAGYLCAVLEGARQTADTSKIVKQFELRDILIGRALEIDGEADVVELVTTFKPRKLGLRSKEAPWTEWTVYSNGQHGHIEHCSGLLYIRYEQEPSLIEQGREENYRNLKLAEDYRSMLSESRKTVAPSEMYANLEEVGLQYGPLFQGIVSIQNGTPGIGCITIQITDTKSAMPAHFEYDHLLHPCTLDACFQSVFTGFTEDGEHKLQAMVPTSIDSIKIAAKLPKGSGSNLTGYALGDKKLFREIVGTVRMSDAEWKSPLIEIEGFSCTELGALTGGQASGRDATAALRKVQSYWHWEPHPAFFSSQIAKSLLGTRDADLQALKTECSLATAEGLEQLAAILGQRALKAMSEEEKTKLQPHLVLYVEWLRTQNKLAHQGALPLQNGSNAWVTMSYEEEETFFSKVVELGIDARLMLAVGRDLRGILDGTVPPLTVMTRDNMLFEYYADAIGAELANNQIAKYCALLGHQKPDMKVLEIGGGTAAITVPILRALDNHQGSTTRCASYVFTDISSGFFEPAEKKLEQWSNLVAYKRLDIEQDPIEQGFEAESFDVIVAANVLHATKNINNTMQNVVKLLRSDGRLVIGEITYPRARVAMIMGTLSGWWLSEDGRQGGPCMSEAQWIEVFERNGLRFDFAVPDLPTADIHMMSTLCATKYMASNLPFSTVAILDNGNPSAELNGFADGVAESLQSHGVVTKRSSLADFAHQSKPDVAVISIVEAEVPLFRTMKDSDFKAVQTVLHATAGALWITKGDRLGHCDPDFRMVDGLLRVLRNEDQSLRLYSLDFDNSSVLNSESAQQSVVDVFTKSFCAERAVTDTEYAYQNGRLHIPRLYDDCPKDYDLRMVHDQRPPTVQPLKQEGRPMRMTIGVPGMLDTIHFVNDERAAQPLPADFIEFENRATALNFMDIMVSMGIISDTELGCEAAGVVVRVGADVTDVKPGDRVVCVCMGAYRNLIRTPASLVQKIPKEMSFEDAASLLAVHTTAYQSLVEIAHLRAGETILIHAAAGGLGQAAIQLAQHIGAEIFVTVGSLAKMSLLMETYSIPEDHIFNSRDLTFADAVLRSTNNKGVDVVLNSLAGEALRKTWTCIKDFGRFIEVGKKDILANAGLEMMPFLRNVIFAGVNLEHIYHASVETLAKLSRKVFELVRAGHIGVVRPTTIFSIGQVEKAFRTMQQGKHTGKIVLSMEDNAQVLATPHDRHPLQLRDNATYLLVGGLGGLGRAQATWLAQNGARYLAFISRSGAASAPAVKTLTQLQEKGVNAKAYTCDVADKDALAKTLALMADEMPRVCGVIQGAMVLSDSFLKNMTFEQWNKAVAPKVQGSYNLHELLPADLDSFIMLSSVAGICGTRGQSNYAAGNTYQDALAHHRRARGLPATVLDLGIMAGHGFVSENMNNLSASAQNMAQQLRSLAIEPHEFFSILKSCITGYTDGDHLMPVQASIGIGTGGMVRAAKVAEHGDWYWHDDPKMSYLRHVDTLETTGPTDKDSTQFKIALATATSLAAAVEIVQAALVAKLAKAMMIPVEDIDVSKPVSSYGVDSLVAVEVRNWLSREMKSDLSVFELLAMVPMAQLVLKVVVKSALLGAEVKAEVGGVEGGDETESKAE